MYRNGCFGQKVPRCYDVHLLPARQETKTPQKLFWRPRLNRNVSKKAICILEKLRSSVKNILRYDVYIYMIILDLKKKMYKAYTIFKAFCVFAPETNCLQEFTNRIPFLQEIRHGLAECSPLLVELNQP